MRKIRTSSFHSEPCQWFCPWYLYWECHIWPGNYSQFCFVQLLPWTLQRISLIGESLFILAVQGVVNLPGVKILKPLKDAQFFGNFKFWNLAGFQLWPGRIMHDLSPESPDQISIAACFVKYMAWLLRYSYAKWILAVCRFPMYMRSLWAGKTQPLE